MQVARSTKYIIIAGCIICFVVIPIVLYMLAIAGKQSSDTTLQPPKRTQDDVLGFIAERNLVPRYRDGSLAVDIELVINPAPKWYIIIYRLRFGDSANINRVFLLNDSQESIGDMEVVFGETVQPTGDQLRSRGVPSTVIKALEAA